MKAIQKELGEMDDAPDENEALKRKIDAAKMPKEAKEKAEAELQETFGQLKIEIKEREEAQIQLEQQSSFLRSFLDASPDLVFIAMKIRSFPAVTVPWSC